MTEAGDLRPSLRPLDVFPTELNGQSVIAFRDPTGLTDRVAFLPRPAALLAVLCDGRREIAEIVAAFHEATGAQVAEKQVRDLVARLDEALLLDSPRFREHRQALEADFRAAPTRPAAHAGQSYPGDSAGLAEQLDELMAGAEALGPETSLLIAPHIDFPRGGPVYGRAYAALRGPSRFDLAIVFGTDHNGARAPFTLTRKSYDTPLGVVDTDVPLVDALAARGGPGLFADELNHRHEHSIEFQAVWLRHLFGAGTPPILPVLCGSLHGFVESRSSPGGHERVRRFLDDVRELTAGRRLLIVAGADLAHVGPRFGDAAYGEAERRTLERADAAALAACATGDAEAFFRSVADEGDRFRVCGLAPIYAALALGGRPGKVLAYDQCDADPEGTSLVSIGAVAA